MKWWKKLKFRFLMWQLDYCPKHLCAKQPPRYSFESICTKCASEESDDIVLRKILEEKRRRELAEQLIKKYQEGL